jgi:hypothetical protein
MNKNDIQKKLQVSMNDEVKRVEERFENVDHLLSYKAGENKDPSQFKKDSKTSISVTINKELLKSLDNMTTAIIINAGDHRLVNRSLLIEFAMECLMKKEVGDIVEWLKVKKYSNN